MRLNTIIMKQTELATCEIYLRLSYHTMNNVFFLWKLRILTGINLDINKCDDAFKTLPKMQMYLQYKVEQQNNTPRTK